MNQAVDQHAQRRAPVPYEQVAETRDAGGALATIEESRVLKAAEARVILAKRFPRDEELARKRILTAFENPRLAEAATYSYPRGSETVSDLSIRAAETMANYWGNLEWGIQELKRGSSYSEMLASCWDLESNNYHLRAFTVRHWRDTKKGGYAVKDERDIYEVTFNQGARRLRSCILECFPAHIKEEVESMIDATMAKSAGGVPIAQRVETMLRLFADHSVTREMIERRLGHNLAAVSEKELVQLRKIYKTIADGQGVVADFFEDETPPQTVQPKPAAAAQTTPAPSAEQSKPKKSVKKDPPAATEPSQAQANTGPAKPETERPAAEQPQQSGDAAMPELTFSQAFSGITRAKSADDLDVIRSQTRHLPERHQTTIDNSIANKLKQLNGEESPQTME